MHGKEIKMEKPFAVLEKVVYSNRNVAGDEDLNATQDLDISTPTGGDKTIMDSTIAIENKTNAKTEYLVRAIVKKKLMFKARPKPIIASITTDA